MNLYNHDTLAAEPALDQDDGGPNHRFAAEAPDPDLERTSKLSVFSGGYTARKVGFWLRHWLELTTLEEDWGSSAGLARELAREWELLRWRQLDVRLTPGERRQVCLCAELHHAGTQAMESLAGGRKVGDARSLVKGMVADLQLAADGLPICWQATRRVYVYQQRWREWLMRYEAWRRAGAAGTARRLVDGLEEPAQGGYGRVVRAMADGLKGGDVCAVLAAEPAHEHDGRVPTEAAGQRVETAPGPPV